MFTDPAIGTDFFGREEIVSILNKRLEAFEKGYRQNVGLVGPRSIGKTSILLNFVFSCRRKGIIPVYVRIMPEPFEYFAQRFMGALLYSALEVSGKELPRDFNSLVKSARRVIPKTVGKMRHIKRVLSGGDLNEAFSELLALTRALHDETSKKIVLAIDDFDLFERFSLVEPFSRFGKEIMLAKDVFYVVSAVRAEKARKIFREDLALLFGNFEVAEVKAFEFEASKRFIENRLDGHVVADRHKRLLVHMTDGCPFYLAVLLERARSVLEVRKQRELTDIVLIDIFEEELFKRQGRLFQYFYLRTNGLGRSHFTHPYLDVLLSVAGGRRKVFRIAKFLNRAVAETKKILLKMADDGVISRSGSFYFLGDPLFAFWLKHVYHLRRISLELDFIPARDEFRKSVASNIEHLNAEDGRDLPRRVEELFKRFKNDVVELRGHNFRCPSFQEILSKPSNGRMFPVEARAQNVRWMCQVASKRIGEDDVRFFVDDIGKLRKKVQRKILIALQGIELNAKLMAQEERIAVWDLRDFNILLDLYDKPKVIL
ncbi:MAG: ATP-binding protein [Candidatus Omnitrophica bacterium]|nr:ATP-binding protein [Candidatus Omnitrophota bacterium]